MEDQNSIYLFHIWMPVSLLILVLFAAWLGAKTQAKSIFGIFIDSRGRYSLTHFQITTWTLVILSTVLGMFISQGYKFDPTFKIPNELLEIMGISVTSGVLATGIKSSKDNSSTAGTILRGLKNNNDFHAKFSQIWLEEEGDFADKTINITKYQNFILTILAVGFYIKLAWDNGDIKPLPETLIGLIGISNAGYVAAKVPDRK